MFIDHNYRVDSLTKHVIKIFQGSTEEWRRFNVLNYEMESSTVLTLTASMGLKGGRVTGVINRASRGRITKNALKKGEDIAIRVAIAASEHLTG